MAQLETKIRRVNYSNMWPIMSYVVKKVKKGKKVYTYVYWQKRIGNKIKNKCIGNIEKLAEFYLQHHQNINNGEMVARGGFEPPICGARGGSKGRSLRWVREFEAFLKPLLTTPVLREFEAWMLTRGRSRKWVKDCLRYLRNGLDLSKRNSITAFKSFLRFLEEEYDVDVAKWQRKLKVPKSNVINVSPDQEAIRDTLLALKDSKYFYVYLLLLTSGLRLDEAVKVLAEFVPDKLRVKNGVHIYELKWLRANKRAYVALWPSWVEFRRLDVTADYASLIARRKGLVRPKFFRKFVATKMLELDMDLYIVDFIEGRTPLQHTVLLTNYAALLNKATKQYAEKYEPWLREFLKDIL